MDSRQTKRVLYLLYTYLVMYVMIYFVQYSSTKWPLLYDPFEKLPLAQVPPFNHLKQRILYSKKANLLPL